MVWINTTSVLIILMYKSIQQEGNPNRELNRPKRTVREDDVTTNHNLRNQNLQSVDALNNRQHSKMTGRDTLGRQIDSSDSLSLSTTNKGQQQPLQQTTEQFVHQQELHQLQQLDNEIIEVTSVADNVSSYWNLTADQRQLRHFWSRKKLLVEGQYAYMSNVFLICLMLACFWWMRGFHMRHNRKMVVSFNEEPNLLTVEEVLFRKAQYLPFIHDKKELHQVFVHDCGNDP